MTRTTKDVAATLRAQGVDASRTNLFLVDPEALTLIVDKDHILYDPRVDLPIDEDFLADIQVNGVMKPINVRRNGTLEDGTPILEVIAGRRRTIHLRELNRRLQAEGGEPRRMPVLFVQGSDADMTLRALSENSHQKAESVMSRATKVRNALKAGATKDSIRRAIGCAPNTVDDLLLFLELSEQVQAAVEDGRLPLGTIKSFSKVEKDEQPQVLARVVTQGATKTHEIRAAVVAATNDTVARLPESKKALPRPKIEQWAAHLVNRAGEARTAFQVLSFILGYKDALDRMPEVKKAAEAAGIVTNEEKREETAETTF